MKSRIDRVRAGRERGRLRRPDHVRAALPVDGDPDAVLRLGGADERGVDEPRAGRVDLGHEGVEAAVVARVEHVRGDREARRLRVARDVCVALGVDDDRGALVRVRAAQEGRVVEPGAGGVELRHERVEAAVVGPVERIRGRRIAGRGRHPRHVGAALRVDRDPDAVVDLGAAEEGRVLQPRARRVDLGDEDVATAVVERVVGAGARRERRRERLAGDVGAALGVDRDVVAHVESGTAEQRRVLDGGFDLQRTRAVATRREHEAGDRCSARQAIRALPREFDVARVSAGSGAELVRQAAVRAAKGHVHARPEAPVGERLEGRERGLPRAAPRPEVAHDPGRATGRDDSRLVVGVLEGQLERHRPPRPGDHHRHAAVREEEGRATALREVPHPCIRLSRVRHERERELPVARPCACAPTCSPPHRRGPRNRLTARTRSPPPSRAAALLETLLGGESLV